MMLPHQSVFDVVGTHPPSSGQGIKWGVKTLHVEQERAVVTLQEGRHSTAPVRNQAKYL